jgi:hypothetical protein
MDGPFVDPDRIGSSRNNHSLNERGSHSSRSITKKPIENPNGRNASRDVGSLISDDQRRDSKIHATTGNEKDNEFEKEPIGPRESIGNVDSKLE